MQLGTSEERVLETGGGERDERREDRVGREAAVIENARDKKPRAVDETSSKLQPIVITVFSLETHAKWEARSVSAVGRILGSDPNSALTIHHIQMVLQLTKLCKPSAEDLGKPCVVTLVNYVGTAFCKQLSWVRLSRQLVLSNLVAGELECLFYLQQIFGSCLVQLLLQTLMMQ